MSQLQLDYGALARAQQKRRRVISVLREVIAIVGLKRFALEAECKESLISDALAGRDRKHIRDEWVYLAMEMAPPAVQDRLAAELVGPTHDAKRRTPLTPEEQLQRYREALRRRLGPMADEIESEVLGGGGR